MIQLVPPKPLVPPYPPVPPAVLDPLLTDTPRLTALVTHHVIAGRLAPGELAGTHTTLAGDEVTIEGMGEDFVAGTGFVAEPKLPTASESSGWGLYLVDRLADRWGIITRDRSEVWFEIDVGA